jgi:hypothetical protein
VAEGASESDEVLAMAGGRHPMALKICTRMGSVRHKLIDEAVAGEGGSHREWRWWRKEPVGGGGGVVDFDSMQLWSAW